MEALQTSLLTQREELWWHLGSSPLLRLGLVGELRGLGITDGLVSPKVQRLENDFVWRTKTGHPQPLISFHVLHSPASRKWPLAVLLLTSAPGVVPAHKSLQLNQNRVPSHS